LHSAITHSSCPSAALTRDQLLAQGKAFPPEPLCSSESEAYIPRANWWSIGKGSEHEAVVLTTATPMQKRKAFMADHIARRVFLNQAPLCW
jgi:hypothetical protein